MDEKRICPKCGNPDCDVTDNYCWNCGLESGNCCENENCFAAGQTEARNGVLDLPDNYSYCPYCGEPTRYAKGGFLKEIDFLH